MGFGVLTAQGGGAEPPSAGGGGAVLALGCCVCELGRSLRSPPALILPQTPHTVPWGGLQKEPGAGGGPGRPPPHPPCLLVRTLGWELLPPAACGNKTTGGLGLPAWCGAAGGDAGHPAPPAHSGFGGAAPQPHHSPPLHTAVSWGRAVGE